MRKKKEKGERRYKEKRGKELQEKSKGTRRKRSKCKNKENIGRMKGRNRQKSKEKKDWRYCKKKMNTEIVWSKKKGKKSNRRGETGGENFR